MNIKDAWDWKAQFEHLEDRGCPPDLADFIADIQEDAIKSTLKLARQKVSAAFRDGKTSPKTARKLVFQALRP
jgi:hypothetical protein